jgi:hypothetical protein
MTQHFTSEFKKVFSWLVRSILKEKFGLKGHQISLDCAIAGQKAMKGLRKRRQGNGASLLMSVFLS